jgi:hypothetical protein
VVGRTLAVCCLVLSLTTAVHAQSESFRELFDGRTLNGWEGDPEVFRVVDGAIVGGSLDAPIARSEYLCSLEDFDDFELRFEAKIRGDQNAGMHFRSERLPGQQDVAGYQADMGFIDGALMTAVLPAVDPDREYPLWGSLLDEYRPETDRYPDPSMPFVLLAIADREVVEGALRGDDWNEVHVLADGPRIVIRLNGVTTVDFTERDERMAQTGKLCLQVHFGGPSEAWYRKISIRHLSRHSP